MPRVGDAKHAAGIESEVNRMQVSDSPSLATVSEAIGGTSTPCEEESIRVPGAMQQHGFALVTDAEMSEIRMASENAERFLRLPLRLILGSRLDTILERELLSGIELLRLRARHEQEGMNTFLGSFRVAGQYFSVVSHRVGTRRVLEFELQDRLVGPEMMNSIITNLVGKLSRLRSAAELCDALTQEVAELTEFDRVLLYRFDDEGHGTVLSEVNHGQLPSFLGLRFPASDIPRQARELYLLNTTRVIPDSDYQPSPLQGVPGEDVVGLDLSLSLLRSVSPVHLQYMRNMGTGASMSVSLVTEGRLWGLISAHNAKPKLVPYLVRSACDMLSKVAGTQLASFETASRLTQTVRFHTVQRNLMTGMAAEPDYLEGLTRLLPDLLDVTNAAGVALAVDGQVTGHGELPDEGSIRRLVGWLEVQRQMEVWSSSHLVSDLPWTEAIRETASGLLAIRISSVQCRFVLWFRPEMVKLVRWAGEPVKIMEANHTLSPRNSFAEWRELVRGCSTPWSAVELESARDFRAALTTVGLRRAEEAIELGEARFQQLTQALPVRVFTADDEGRLTYTNERWHATGMGGTGRWYDDPLLRTEDTATCAHLWAEAVRENRTFEAEVRLTSTDSAGGRGPERWNFVRGVPFRRAGAARAGWIGCFIDMTESKERETVLRMNEKLALTGRMTSVIAHEINNPLEAITNLMYLLRSEINTSGPATGYIGMVESELERISGITKQTLRWNRESSDAREEFRAGEMVDDVLRLFAGKIRNRQITVRVEGGRDVRIFGILGQLRQVLANLLSNAVDAAPVGGRVTVRLLGGGAGEDVGFAVQDNGKGIPEEVQSRLFEPFYSTKGDLGNGLGLYISREIMERHAGHVGVENSSPEGTTMKMTLPARSA